MLGKIFNNQVLDVLREMALYFWLFPFLAILILRKHLTSGQVRLVYIVLVMFLNELLTRLLRVNEIDNLWVYHIYVPMLFWSVTHAYATETTSLKHKRLLKVASVLFSAFCLYESLYLKRIFALNSMSIIVASSAYIVMSIVYLRNLLNQDRAIAVYKLPLFWLSSGGIVYYASTFVLFAFYEQIINDSQLFIVGWTLNAVFYLLLIMCYTVGLLKWDK